MVSKYCWKQNFEGKCLIIHKRIMQENIPRPDIHTEFTIKQPEQIKQLYRESLLGISYRQETHYPPQQGVYRGPDQPGGAPALGGPS